MAETQYSTNGGVTYRSSLITGVITQNRVFLMGGLALTNVILGTGVTSISNGAFAYCSSLATINIPSSVTTIGSGVFYDCTNLTTVAILSSVISISDYAFENCGSLANMTFESPLTLSTISDNLFVNIRSNSTRTFYFNNTDDVSQINTSLLDNIRSITNDDTVSVTGPQIFIVPNTITTVITVDSFNKTYGDIPFNLTPSSNSSARPFSYSSNNTQVATVGADTGLVTLVGVGSAVITVSQPEIAGYTSGTATSTIQVNASTSDNPVIITDGPELEYWLTTNAPYGSLTNDITVVDNLTNDCTVLKNITTSTNQPINIVK